MPFLDAEATMAKFAATQTAVIEPPAPTEALAPIEITADALKLAHLQSRETAQPVATGYGVAEVPDLRQLVVDRVNLMGKAESAVFYGRSLKTVEAWVTGKSSPTLEDLQKTLQRPVVREDRRAIEVLSHLDIPEGNFAVAQKVQRTPVQILICAKGDIPLPCAVSWVALALKDAPYFRWSGDSLLVHGRNRLADAFLKTDMEYALTLDADCIPPLGSPWFREVTGGQGLPMTSLDANLISRMVGHRKEMVGGCYASRERGMPMVTQPDMEPKGEEDLEFSEELRRGTAKGLRQVKWLASGCCLIHRSVFERVRDRFKDEMRIQDGQVFPYYTPIANEGEDVAFCNRVAACGIPMWLDSELILGHLGRQFFLPHQTLPAKRLG